MSKKPKVIEATTVRSSSTRWEDSIVTESTGGQRGPCVVPCVWTGQQGTPACGRTGKELEHEQYPYREERYSPEFNMGHPPYAKLRRP